MEKPNSGEGRGRLTEACGRLQQTKDPNKKMILYTLALTSKYRIEQLQPPEKNKLLDDLMERGMWFLTGVEYDGGYPPVGEMVECRGSGGG